MKISRIHAIAAATLLASPFPAEAQQTAAVAAVSAAAAPAVAPAALPVAAAPTPTLWRFLGIPQTARALRTGLVNRRGNFPGLERKPPLVPIAAPENLESPNPAIKAAAEVKQAEDMKKQKIKAIKYLASIGCGCYDKDGKITDALLAGTDDCTPDVRLAVIEAIEDNVNQDCCKRCGTTSCCNEKTSKRLSEMAYELDDSGCHLEPSAEIRRAAARVLKKCCPGGPPTGPIEEEYEPMEPESPVELIPAPEGEETPRRTPPRNEPNIKGEQGDDEEKIRGESGGDRVDELDNPFDDEKRKDLDVPERDVEDLIRKRATNNDSRPIEMSLGDLSPIRHPVNSSPVLIPVAVDAPESGTRVINESSSIELVRPIGLGLLTESESPKKTEVLTPAARRWSAPPVAATPSVPSRDFTDQRATKSEIEPGLMEVEVPAARKVVALPVATRLHTPNQVAKSEMSVAVQSYSAPSRSSSSEPAVTAPRFAAVAEVAFVNYQTGELLLKGAQLNQLRSGTVGDIYRTTAGGTVRIGQLNVRVIGRSTAQAEVDDLEVLRNIRMGDQVICP